MLQSPSRPGTAHDLQVPPQAVAQQRPCAQMVLSHCEPPVQTAPSGFLPQSPAVQKLPLLHWESPLQLLRQALPLHPR